MKKGFPYSTSNFLLWNWFKMTAQTVRSTADGLVTPQSWLYHEEFQHSVDVPEHVPRNTQQTELPVGFPRSVEGLMSWSGIDLDHDDLQVLRLNRKKIRGIEVALLSFLCE